MNFTPHLCIFLALLGLSRTQQPRAYFRCFQQGLNPSDIWSCMLQAATSSTPSEPEISENVITSVLGEPISDQTRPLQAVAGFLGVGDNSRGSSIRHACQYTSECQERTPNTVCYSGLCLCNIGYHYAPDTDNCIQDSACPVCATDTCTGGVDIFCNNTCYPDYKQIQLRNGSVEQLMSPNWPDLYPAETDRFYCLTSRASRRVNLKLAWFDLETNVGQDGDYIKVYDGCKANDHQNLLAFYHGDNGMAGECVTSKCHQMLVHFHSDVDDGTDHDQRTGFMGYYKEVAYDDDQC